MVRVFKYHRFKGKEILPVEDEPLSICGEGKRVFVACRLGSMSVFTLNTDPASTPCWSESHRFNTINPVDKVIYNQSKNFIFTLESKKSFRGVTRSTRVYLNWEVMQIGTQNDARTKVRMAGKAHSLQQAAKQGDSMEVIEMQMDGKVTDIAVCPTTGNLAVAVGREVKLCHLVEKVVPNQQHTYCDVEPFLELCFRVPVALVSTCLDLVVAVSSSEAQCVRIHYQDTGEMAAPGQAIPAVLEESDRFSTTTDGESSTVTPSGQNPGSLAAGVQTDTVEFSRLGRSSMTPSSGTSQQGSDSISACGIVDDEYFQAWTFDEDFGDFEARGKPPKTIHLKSLHGSTQGALLTAPPPSLRDLRGGPFKSASKVGVTTCLYVLREDQEEWAHVQLLPVYTSDPGQLLEGGVGGAPMWGVGPPTLAALTCFLSSVQGGDLYSVVPKPALVTRHKYTNPAVRILASPSLLHVTTTSGLETYTARTVAVAAQNADHFDFVNKACPPSDLDTCLCGIETFIGASHIALAEGHLILLTKLDDHKDSDGGWCLSGLKQPSTSELYKDMVEFATNIQESGPSSYIQVLQETNFLLRGAVLAASQSHDLQDLFQESCALMGMFYSLPGCKEWRLCLPYIQMSGLPLHVIINQAVSHRHYTEEDLYVYGRGLLYFLNKVLFEDDEPLDIKQSVCDKVLEIYSDTEPENLSSVILRSRLKNFTPELAVELLKKWINHQLSRSDKVNSTDLLTLADLHLQLCDLEAAQTVLSALDQSGVLEACLVNPTLIHKDFKEFTPLAQLMRKHYPTLLLPLLVRMLDHGAITFDVVLSLLQAKQDVFRVNQIKEFLEIVVNDIKRKYLFDELVWLLCQIYIWRISQPLSQRPGVQSEPRHSTLPHGTGHFAQRYGWLDDLPPFLGAASEKRPCLVSRSYLPSLRHRPNPSPPLQSSPDLSDVTTIPCLCFTCNEDLLKLQSLLCSDFLTEELAERVKGRLQEKQSLTGRESLELLCGRITERDVAVQLVVSQFPAVFPAFACSLFGRDKNKWQHAMNHLHQTLKQVVASKPSPETEAAYLQTYRETLSRLAELFPPEEFLQLLPGEGSFAFHLPFLQQSLRHRQASQLRSAVVQQAEEALSSS